MDKGVLGDRNPADRDLHQVDADRRTRYHVLIAAVLLLGIFFRFFCIDCQLYWYDEVYTSLRIAGYQISEIEQELRDGAPISVAEMQKYQTPHPDKSVRDTVQGLADEEPQLVPLYFVLARYWVLWFGNSIAAIRSLSAVLSLLALPCVYWLCRELFDGRKVGGIAVALFAISPVQIVFAQEARPYSLFIVLILLSSVALLRAMRLNTWLSWTIYAVVVALGLYTHVLFGFVAIGHAIHVFTVSRFRICRTSISYVIASFFALLTLAPWLQVMATNRAQNVEFADTTQSLIQSLTRWSGIVSRTFVDLGIGPGDSLTAKLSLLPCVALILLLIAYSIYFLVARAPMRQWLFVLTLIASVALPLLAMDIGFGKRYGTTRYILPTSIGIQLSVAYLLSLKINDFAISRWRRRFWQTTAVLLVLGGILSCTIRSGHEMWWNKVPDDYGDYPQMARLVNQADQPVIYCYGHWSNTQIMCHRLDRDVRLQLMGADKVPQLSGPVGDVFLFNSTDETRSSIEQSYNVKVQQAQGVLWKVVQRPPN